MDILKRSALCLALLSLAAQPVLAQESETEEDEEEALVVPIEVEAPELRVQQGRSEYNAEFIETMPTGQGDLADLLRMNPAVEFSRDADLSAGAAALRPEEISIHGQLYYQNLFLIDGADTTSDIDPAASRRTLRINPTGDQFSNPDLFGPMGGSSPQGYYLDVDLLDSVEVYDSNIPVEFGGFTGGVVKAQVKSYQGENTFSWHFGMQRDEWEEFHINPDDVTANERYNGVYTPDYQKSNYGFTLQRGLGDNLGLTLGVTRRQSRFAQEYEDDADIVRMVEYEDHIDNLMGRLDTKLGNTDAGLSFRYTTRTHDGITSDTYTGAFEKDHEGFGFTADFGRPLTTGTLDLKLTFDRVSDSIDSDSNYFVFQQYREGIGESRYEGGYGDTQQQQTRVGLKPKWSLNPLNLGGREHTITVGGEYRNTRTYYERDEDDISENYRCVRYIRGMGRRDQD
ncbi:MAG: TonB-dependent receptor plug domain-containing protein [Rhodospirillaceae bacterium]|nr:TonB-dependent receptor plug domain-containing protein [Rhodospirillaceae bacterium]